jgi:hypothetical protein
MKRVLLVATPLLCLLLFVAGAQQPQKTGRISGRVHRSDAANSPFVDAAVSLRLADEQIPEDKRLVAEVKTDSTSRYSFPSVPPGNYTIAARVLFRTDADAPCPVVSTGLTLFPEHNAQGWSVHMIRTNIGVIEGIFSEPFALVSGQNVTKDIDLKCK